jgi:hypothetical protein
MKLLGACADGLLYEPRLGLCHRARYGISGGTDAGYDAQHATSFIIQRGGSRSYDRAA